MPAPPPQTEPPPQRTYPLWLALLWLGCLYAAADAGRHALDDVDGLYAAVARGMLKGGATPIVDGVRFLDKPPLLYWVMGGSTALFGPSDGAGRLPLVLAVLGTAFLLGSAARRAGEASGGFWGALAFGLSTGTFLFTRTIQPDTLLVFFEALAFWAFLEWRREKKKGPALLFYVALAGAMLSKGLIGLVLPLGGVGLFLLVRGKLRSLLAMEPLRGTLLFAGLVCPWFVVVARENPGFLRHFFLEEHLQRFLGTRMPHDYSSISLPVFWLLLLVWLLPWTPLLGALPGLLREEGGRDLAGLCAAWGLFGLLFFSVSSRLEHYAFAFLPPLTLLLGLSTARFVEGGRGALGVRVSAFLCLGLGVLLAAGAFLLPGPGGGRHLGADTTDFGPLFHLPGEIVSRLGPLALLAGLALGLGGGAVLWLAGRAQRAGAAVALALVATSLCGLATKALHDCEESLSSHTFGRALARIARPADRVFVMGDFETANSLLLDVDLPLLVFDGHAWVLEWGLGFPDAPKRVFARSEFLEAWRGGGRVFLLAPVDEVPGLALPRSYEVRRSMGRALLSNAPP